MSVLQLAGLKNRKSPHGFLNKELRNEHGLSMIAQRTDVFRLHKRRKNNLRGENRDESHLSCSLSGSEKLLLPNAKSAF